MSKIQFFLNQNKIPVYFADNFCQDMASLTHPKKKLEDGGGENYE